MSGGGATGIHRVSASPRSLFLGLGLGLALLLAGCAGAPKLPANGQVPRAVVIEDDHGDPQTLLVRPVDHGRLTSGFNWRSGPGGPRSARHDGLDWVAPSGTPVRAAGAGRVVQMGWQSGYGRILLIRHTSRYETAYAHLSGFARGLRVGQQVRQGQVVAYVGATGNATAPHVHYEIRYRGKAIDPLSLPAAGSAEISISWTDPPALARPESDTARPG